MDNAAEEPIFTAVNIACEEQVSLLELIQLIESEIRLQSGLEPLTLTVPTTVVTTTPATTSTIPEEESKNQGDTVATSTTIAMNTANFATTTSPVITSTLLEALPVSITGGPKVDY